MPEVAVVTDSTANLPPELVERYGIEIVPLYIVFGGDRTVHETEITDYPAFFEELRQAESLPTTSQPSVGDFTQAYEPLLAAGKDVVSIHISAGLSGTCESARQAAEALERDGKGGERVRVIDSETAAGGLGLMALVAARAAESGADLDAIEARFRRGPRRAQDVVRDRHARVPQARRANRRRQRLDRLDAQDEADPDPRERAHAGRARADERAYAGAAGRLRAPAPRVRARTAGPSSTSTRPSSARRCSSAAGRSSARSRCW